MKHIQTVWQVIEWTSRFFLLSPDVRNQVSQPMWNWRTASATQSRIKAGVPKEGKGRRKDK